MRSDTRVLPLVPLALLLTPSLNALELPLSALQSRLPGEQLVLSVPLVLDAEVLEGAAVSIEASRPGAIRAGVDAPERPGYAAACCC